jgi:hypothetical protein
MQLSPREEVLVETFRRLHPKAAMELSALAERLAALGSGGLTDWSDSWSETDLQAFTSDSLQRLDSEEQENAR